MKNGPQRGSDIFSPPPPPPPPLRVQDRTCGEEEEEEKSFITREMDTRQGLQSWKGGGRRGDQLLLPKREIHLLFLLLLLLLLLLLRCIVSQKYEMVAGKKKLDYFSCVYVRVCEMYLVRAWLNLSIPTPPSPSLSSWPEPFLCSRQQWFLAGSASMSIPFLPSFLPSMKKIGRRGGRRWSPPLLLLLLHRREHCRCFQGRWGEGESNRVSHRHASETN